MTDITPRELAFRATVMAAIAKHALKEKDRYRIELTDVMANGEKLMPADPAHPGSRLGRVNKTDPDDDARLTNPRAFTAWMAAKHPEQVSAEWTIPPENMKRAIDCLHAYAPELLVQHVNVLPWATAEALKLTATERRPCGPNKETDVPGVEFVPAGEGTIVVTPSRDALDVIARMVREGRLDIQTGEILAIEGIPGNGK